MDSKERSALLRRVPLFAKLAEGDLGLLARATTTRRVAARQELFHKGDAGGRVFVIARGRLKVVANSLEGDELILALMDAGEVFGELALLTGGERTATVVALEDSELLALERRDFLAFLHGQPQAATPLLETLAARLQRLGELLEDRLFLRLEARLAKKLLALARSYGTSVDGGVRIDLRLSQSELGDLVGTTRESVNKQLRAWAREGLVRSEGGVVTLLDAKALERLADLVEG